MVNESLTSLDRPEIKEIRTVYAAILAHARVGIPPGMAPSAAVGESQAHLAAAGIVMGNMDVRHSSGVG